MGSSTQKSTSTSGPSNADLNATVSKLSKGLGAEYTQGKSLYQAPGANTVAGWNGSLAAANNSDFTGGIAGALQSYGNRAAGNELGINDPLYAAQRSRLTDNVLTSTNTAFNNSGLFGSDNNQYEAGRGLADALGSLDLSQRTESYGRQAEAANLLPQLFSAGQLPSSIQGSVGASQDAAAQAQANGPTDYLAKLTSIMAGNASASGTTTTTSQPTPALWQTLLGLGISAL